MCLKITKNQGLKCEFYSLNIYFFRSVKFQSSQKRKVVVEEEIIEEMSDNDEPETKTQKVDDVQNKTEIIDPLIESTASASKKPSTSTSNTQSWNRSVGVISRKNALTGLVKVKKQDSASSSSVLKDNNESKSDASESTNQEQKTVSNEAPTTNGLSLLGAYSDSDSNQSE